MASVEPMYVFEGQNPHLSLISQIRSKGKSLSPYNDVKNQDISVNSFRQTRTLS